MNRTLGFSREEIEANLKRIGYECNLLNRNGVVALVAAVSPYRDQRDRMRAEIGRFVEVFCRCPLDVLAKRDTSGLIEKAQSGEVDSVAGVNAPYEAPQNAEVTVDTDRLTPEECVHQILDKLVALAYLPQQDTAAYTAEEEAMIKQRLSDLGYI